MKRLPKSFFQRNTAMVAQELLGKVLVFKDKNRTLSGIIVETEAYVGSKDLANHASRGKTPRNEVMFDEAGNWYIYIIYGFYNCLNIVTEKKGYPAAVLIRALEPIGGLGRMKINRGTEEIKNLASGPGKLCQALGIDRRFNYLPATNKKSPLFIGDMGIKIKPNQIFKTTRVGVDYAGKWKNKLLRFYIKDSAFISKK